ncbi:MAG: hypothetical protein KGK01_02955 [Bradyrhizobium sp.]|nr:hypothetical protein [Pseudomonadota bacterium]MDE2067571.1 hypothetical protein [Bradyrhizobium sp.]MDE2241420.1 hypothetical protein [Bradyrhizobium sp.]MDE2470822.1 hypothetical protein [Bradyrhizobium sp.]
MEKINKPPSRGSRFVTIGRNSRGYWVAQENNGLFGGLFVSRAQAFKYALSENGHHSGAIVLTPNVVELDMHRKTYFPLTAAGARSLRSRAARRSGSA